MNEKDLPTGSGEEFEDVDPDTNTDEPEGEESSGPKFPEAEPAPGGESTPADIPVAPPPSAGPRVFKEHFMLLFGMAMVLAATLSVWRRQEIFGYTLTGAMSIKRTFLMGLAIYGIGAGIANIATGRLKAMGMAFVTGVAALWLGIKEFLAFNDVDGFMGWSEMESHLKETGGSNFQILSEKWLGQWGPGVWMSTIGGAIIVFVFLKALFPKKKEAAAPPPPSRRRGRR